MQTDPIGSEKKIWFRAKKYGWGWGAPCTWQGWVVLIGWLLLVEGGSFWLVHAKQILGFYIFLGAMVTLFVAICWAKGEKPKWRWGNK